MGSQKLYFQLIVVVVIGAGYAFAALFFQELGWVTNPKSEFERANGVALLAMTLAGLIFGWLRSGASNRSELSRETAGTALLVGVFLYVTTSTILRVLHVTPH